MRWPARIGGHRREPQRCAASIGRAAPSAAPVGPSALALALYIPSIIFFTAHAIYTQLLFVPAENTSITAAVRSAAAQPKELKNMASPNGIGGSRPTFPTTATALGNTPSTQKQPPAPETSSSRTLKQPPGNPTDDRFLASAPKPGTLQADAKKFTEDQLEKGVEVLERLGTGSVHLPGANSDKIITLKELKDGYTAFKGLMGGGKAGIKQLCEKLGLPNNPKSTAYLKDVEKTIDFLHRHGAAIAGKKEPRDQIFVDDLRHLRQSGMLKDAPLPRVSPQPAAPQPAAPQLKPFNNVTPTSIESDPAGGNPLSVTFNNERYTPVGETDNNINAAGSPMARYKAPSGKYLTLDVHAGKVWQSVQDQQPIK